MPNTETKAEPIRIDASIIPKLREWFAAGRGVRVWRCADLSSGKVGHMQFTPADNRTAPHWSYTDSGAILPADIIVETFTPRVSFNGTVKRKYWGIDVSDASRAKADRLKQTGETWVFAIEYDCGRTYAKIEIGRMVESRFQV